MYGEAKKRSAEIIAIRLSVIFPTILYIKIPIKMAEKTDINLPIENEIPKSLTSGAQAKAYTGG